MKTLKDLNIIKQIGHQGDTQWFSIKGIPENAKLIEKRFIAASEKSGSFHALFGDYDQYEIKDGFILDVKEECILNHSLKEHLGNKPLEKAIELPKKDHRHSRIAKGLYYVGIQQKFDPLSGLKEKVRD